LITPGEIAHGIAGAARIIRLDVRVHDWFDDSLTAAKRSFWGAAITLPVQLLLDLVPRGDASGVASSFDPVLTTLDHVIAWTLYPLAAWHMARAFGLGAYFPRYLTAYNWWNTLQLVLLAPLIALASYADPDSRATLLATIGLIYTLLYAGYAVFIARVMLRAQLGHAVILMVVDLMISQTLAQLIQAIRAGPQM
jgi:hypothetical protein